MRIERYITPLSKKQKTMNFSLTKRSIQFGAATGGHVQSAQEVATMKRHEFDSQIRTFIHRRNAARLFLALAGLLSWFTLPVLAVFTPTPIKVNQTGLPGSLDTTFGNGGIVTNTFKKISQPNAVAIQPDGKIVVAGYDLYTPGGGIAIARYNKDGSLDNSFGGNGKVITSISGYDGVRALAIQADGKIVVTGHTGGRAWDILVARYNSDGSLDPSFDGDGITTIDIPRMDNRIYDDVGYGVAIQKDGKIVILRDSYYLDPDTLNDSDHITVAARYNIDGSLDASFASGGIATSGTGKTLIYGSGMALRPDGKIIVLGTDYDAPITKVARYNADGSLDATFGHN